ncbi:Type III pantothenate kinase [Hyella patelloides LEGE 07179]|uniref:Type III pantothenate kinase n=1 Tax=Hyella patelloides LEGE 07179 TaxID=945734 RepID=A0A563VX01_9CYAN|nr:pantothenate kinase [Hyella patelloides]VEP15969.1 Type III pantothenate kinase [Hyella patelloides LEGE 07179]
MDYWLGLVIGNSHLHWAWFVDNILQEAWDTPHLLEEINSATSLSTFLPNRYQKTVKNNSLTIYLASVVPFKTALWSNYPQLHQITVLDIPLLNTYATLGIDRALAIYGAGETYNYPCLVIDGGTALTFTAVDRKKALIGGAILPGLRSQLRSLHQHTAALPQANLPSDLPPRWALDTEKAISSGIIYTTMAGIHSYINNWWDKFPDSSIIFTGGDSKLIFHYLQTLYPQVSKLTLVDRNLIFWGLQSLKKRLKDET